MTHIDLVPELLWQPSAAGESLMARYIDWLGRERDVTTATYEDLWTWPVEHLAVFRASLWEFFEVGTNIPEAVVALLATAAVGAVWSCCPPDYGTGSVSNAGTYGVKGMLQAGVVPITTMALVSEWMHDWANAEAVDLNREFYSHQEVIFPM
jgi:hypothetical protein